MCATTVPSGSFSRFCFFGALLGFGIVARVICFSIPEFRLGHLFL